MANWQDYITIDSTVDASKEVSEYITGGLKRTLNKADYLLQGKLREKVIESLKEMASTDFGLEFLKGAFKASGNRKVSIIYNENEHSMAKNIGGVSVILIGGLTSKLQYCDSNMQNCKDASIQSILAHELSHIRHNHSRITASYMLSAFEIDAASMDGKTNPNPIRNSFKCG